MRGYEIPFIDTRERRKAVTFCSLSQAERWGYKRPVHDIGAQLEIAGDLIGEGGFKPDIAFICDDGGNLKIRREIFLETVQLAKKKKAVLMISSRDRLTEEEYEIADKLGVPVIHPELPDNMLCESDYRISKNV